MFSWGHLKTLFHRLVNKINRKNRTLVKKTSSAWRCHSWNRLRYVSFFRNTCFSFVYFFSQRKIYWVGPFGYISVLMGTTVGSWVFGPKTIFEDFKLTMNNDESHSFGEFHNLSNKQWTMRNEIWYTIFLKNSVLIITMNNISDIMIPSFTKSVRFFQMIIIMSQTFIIKYYWFQPNANSTNY